MACGKSKVPRMMARASTLMGALSQNCCPEINWLERRYVDGLWQTPEANKKVPGIQKGATSDCMAKLQDPHVFGQASLAPHPTGPEFKICEGKYAGAYDVDK